MTATHVTKWGWVRFILSNLSVDQRCDQGSMMCVQLITHNSLKREKKRMTKIIITANLNYPVNSKTAARINHTGS